jgi:hypothetical protein
MELKRVHMNKTDDRQYREFYKKPEWIEKIRNYYKEEIEMFGYEF